VKKSAWIILITVVAVLAVAVTLNVYYIPRSIRTLKVDFSQVTKVQFSATHNKKRNTYSTILEGKKLQEFLKMLDTAKLTKSADQRSMGAYGIGITLYDGNTEIGSFGIFPTTILISNSNAKNKYASIRYNSSTHFDYDQLESKYLPESTQQP